MIACSMLLIPTASSLTFSVQAASHGAGQMRPVQPRLFRYACRFSGITRRSPAPSRVTQLLRDCLVLAHINHPAPEPCPIQV
jgi:hypothetical protein